MHRHQRARPWCEGRLRSSSGSVGFYGWRPRYVFFFELACGQLRPGLLTGDGLRVDSLSQVDPVVEVDCYGISSHASPRPRPRRARPAPEFSRGDGTPSAGLRRMAVAFEGNKGKPSRPREKGGSTKQEWQVVPLAFRHHTTASPAWLVSRLSSTHTKFLVPWPPHPPFACHMP